MFTEEVNLIATDDKRIQSKDSMETYKYRTSQETNKKTQKKRN